jgi:hypothetical protein
LATGGFLRERPLPRTPYPTGSDWPLKDMETDIRRADALGIDGFSVDLLSPPSPTNVAWTRVLTLLDVAEKVDPTFKIMIMPDFGAGYKAHPEALTDAILQLSKYPNVYRLSDGRLVVAPFFAENQPPQWWADWMQSMKAQGVNVAFMPLFLGWKGFAAQYASVSFGMSDWGERSTTVNKPWINTPAEAHKYTSVWMMPVSPQDMRPKDPIYWEADNSDDYREMWMNTIDGNADWAQVITWNDYSESTEISPSTGTQWAFYDLTAYYTAWFKTGHAPKIKRDVLYYFHRVEPATGSFDPSVDHKPFGIFPGSDPPRDDIELLAFLTKTGTIAVTIAGKTYQEDAPAGVTSFHVPLAAGVPSFSLTRGGKTTISFQSAFTIVDKTPYQDLLYRGGSSSRPPVPMAQQADVTPP